MKKDYLWDKTGEDSEIERLEIALQAFRYKETAAPALPAKVLPLRKAPVSRRSFPLAFAAAAACLAIAFGIWLQVSRNKIESASSGKIEVTKDLAETVSPQNTAAPLVEPSIEEPNDLTVKKTKAEVIKNIRASKQFSKQNVVAFRKIISKGNPQNELLAKNVKTTEPDSKIKQNVRLTKEEQYAYDQLMLALSITSSKLKLVKDKVEGIEEYSTVNENER